MSRITRDQVLALVGKQVYVLRKDGSRVSGKLVRVSGSRLILAQPRGKKVGTQAILPLVLFDVLAIGTSPYAWGGWGGLGGWGGGLGGGYGGIGGFGGGLGWW